MSVTIFKRGTLKADRQFVVECRNCGCRFGFTHSDADLVLDQRDGNFYRIPCPTCHEEVTKAALP